MNLINFLKSKLRKIVSTDIFANIFFNQIIINLFIGKRSIKHKGKSSKKFLEDSFLFLNKNFEENDSINNLLRELKIKLDKVDFLFKEADEKYEYVKMKNPYDKEMEVFVDKSYGTLQIRNLEKKQKIIDNLNNLIRNNKKIREIVEIYGNPKIESIKLERKKITIAKRKSNYGNDYNSTHIDSRKPSLKIYIFLSKINNNNGPLKIYRSTSNWHKFPKIALVIKLFNQNYFSRNFCKSFEKTVQFINGDIGDSIIFSGNSLHSASNVEKGARDTLQIYFQNPDINWYRFVPSNKTL